MTTAHTSQLYNNDANDADEDYWGELAIASEDDDLMTATDSEIYLRAE